MPINEFLDDDIDFEDLDDDPFYSEFDQLSDAEQAEIEEREVFNDRYNAWRNEY